MLYLRSTLTMATFVNGKLTRNKNKNFFEKIGVVSTSFSDHSYSWDFISQGLSIVAESTNCTDVIEYSFNGDTVHGDLTPGFSGAFIWDDRRECKIFFRRKTEGNSVVVRLEVWRNEY